MGLAPDLGAELEEATTACDKIRNGKEVRRAGDVPSSPVQLRLILMLPGGFCHNEGSKISCVLCR